MRLTALRSLSWEPRRAPPFCGGANRKENPALARFPAARRKRRGCLKFESALGDRDGCVLARPGAGLLAGLRAGGAIGHAVLVGRFALMLHANARARSQELPAGFPGDLIRCCRERLRHAERHHQGNSCNRSRAYLVKMPVAHVHSPIVDETPNRCAGLVGAGRPNGATRVTTLALFKGRRGGVTAA